jgi:hypothetical protein
MRAEVPVVERQSGREIAGVVLAESAFGISDIQLLLADGREFSGDGYDVEAALGVLRSQLDEVGLLLLCNRFRRDALVTSLSRQMSGGLSCYLVKRRKDLNPDELVNCLDPAPRSEVVTGVEAEAYISGWKEWFEKPTLLRWVDRLLHR